MTRAFIVLERFGSTWQAPRNQRNQHRSSEYHVKFTYVGSEDFEQFTGKNPRDIHEGEVLAQMWAETAARVAHGYAFDASKSFLVIPVDAGTVVETQRPPQPTVTVNFRPVSAEDVEQEVPAA